MRALLGLAAENDLQVVEDAAQAHGATRDGIRPGASGVAAFSFYPGKNLGAFGDAGAIVTDDPTIAATARALREHGQTKKYVHDFVGYTGRLDTLQAVALTLKLRNLDEHNAQRRAAAAFYRHHLAGIGDVELPPEPADSSPVFHLYVIRSRRRDALAAHLNERGISTGLHYPEPPHLSRAFAWLGYQRGDFPYAERLSRDGLSLPIFPGITERQLTAVCTAVRSFFDG
jgi:dTDP-4-amino-4,6-dideoxygalactose transaminase